MPEISSAMVRIMLNQPSGSPPQHDEIARRKRHETSTQGLPSAVHSREDESSHGIAMAIPTLYPRFGIDSFLTCQLAARTAIRHSTKKDTGQRQS